MSKELALVAYSSGIVIPVDSHKKGLRSKYLDEAILSPKENI